MRNTVLFGSLLFGLFLGLFLLASLTDGVHIASRLPNVPSDSRFQVTAAIVELKPHDAVLGGNSFRTILDDIPKRRQVGLGILDANDISGKLIHTKTTRILKQGDDFSVSFELPKEKDTATGPQPYLRRASADVHLLSVDTLQTAEVNVTGQSEWYADLIKTNHSTGFGGGIPGYGCFTVGTSEMFPLFVQPEGSAWIVLSVTKLVN